MNEQMTLKQRQLRVAILGSLKNLVFEANEVERRQLLEDMLDVYKAPATRGDKGGSIFLPSGDKVATVTLSESKPETVVTDRDAFLEWCRTHRPELVEVVHHPAVEAWEETIIRPAAAAHVAKDYKVAGDTYITADGEPVEGVEYRLPKDPKQFSITYTAKDKGLSLVEAWREGQVGIELGPNLPQIGGAL